MTAAPRSIEEAIDWLRARFRADAAHGAFVLYRVVLTGEGGGGFSMRVEGNLQLALELRSYFALRRGQASG